MDKSKTRFLSPADKMHRYYESSAFAASRRITAEQRSYCERVEELHRGPSAHVSDGCLAEVKYGVLKTLGFTSADVKLNLELRGPCILCLQGKYVLSPCLP